MVYYKSIIDKDCCIYSVDKVLVQFHFDYHNKLDSFVDSLSNFLDNDMFEYSHYSSFRIGSFREQFSFKCHGESFWLGVGLNSAHVVNSDCRIEFNPNKVGNEYILRWILNSLLLYSASCKILQYDLAVDIPISRINCYLVKDRRKYEEVRYSESDRTQYLGQRNSPGRCKLYNKTIEQRLDFPLTRFEMTIDGKTRDPVVISMLCPEIRLLDDFQLSMCGIKINDTDLFIIKTLLDAPDRIVELSYYKKKKFHQLLAQCSRTFSFDLDCVAYIVDVLSDFVNPFDLSRFIVSPFDGSFVLCDS